MISMEEQMHLFMYEVFCEALGEVFRYLDQAIVKEKQKLGWKVERKDWRTLQFTFGQVRFQRTLMKDEKNKSVYPFDKCLGIRNHQRYSSLVELKVAELVSESTYRETARILKEWTAVSISHHTAGSILKQVGKAQAEEDKEMVLDLEDSATLPEGKKVEFLMAEADGVFVRDTKKRKSIEVHHAVTYEGWVMNGNRVSLLSPQVIMTTKSTEHFWSEVQTLTAYRYSLEEAQVVTNSDGGAGYSAEKFQEAFSQSEYTVLNQLDPYHISQGLNRAFGAKNKEWKSKVKEAIETKDKEKFIAYLDTYESIIVLEDEKRVKKINEFRTYILRNWERIFDWRKQVENPPEGARGLGAMESHQRHISYRMKKRGMHWSKEGAEAMVKVKQGILNDTLRNAYLKNQKRSVRKEREVKKMVKIASLLRDGKKESIGAKKGRIAVYGPTSSAIGELAKIINR